VGRLISTAVSKNLLHVFRLMEAAKKAAPVAAVRPVRAAGVLGAGVMGGGIAQLLAAHGIDVRLRDIRADAISMGLRHARELFDRAVSRRRMDAREAARALDRISPTLEVQGFRHADIVIEAVIERLDVKQSVLREIENHLNEEAVLTSNTSALSITEMARALRRPDAFCGMHFFNPVHRMPLVEVVRGQQSSDRTIASVFALARTLEKTPIIVKDGPGFLVNRILSPYLNEAGYLLADGAAIEAVDEALLDFGMPMGPLRLLDEIGLDIARHAGQVLYDAFGERMRPAPPLAALDEAKLLGRKGRLGFYRYEDDRESGVNQDAYAALGLPASRTEPGADSIRERTLLAMVNEAARALEDEIVPGPADVDLAMITGTGFPPFRGGLLRWADTLGLEHVLRRLHALEQQHGPRFAPAQLIRLRAEARRGFYD
jgi:3-hydroxyacyl-CoA dehydrogenase/enoyl-CoA hydratase/3-hydroxybutyryl-CoA epimerase